MVENEKTTFKKDSQTEVVFGTINGNKIISGTIDSNKINIINKN